jgi:LuxR family quorum sensing-dependent transcriptional regulator
MAGMASLSITALSAREREVLYWIGEGKSDWEIARIMSLAPKTVNGHAERAKRKFGVANRMQLVRVALRLGLLMV